ncbi:nucleoside-diphosphate-sugar epimerase family protein [Seiridium cupressi]
MSDLQYYLVAGATGRQGGAVVDALLSRPTVKVAPSSIYAITRQGGGPGATKLCDKYRGIRILPGNLSDPNSIFQQLEHSILSKAGVFLAQTHGPTELGDAKGFIDAAVMNGIPYFVYSSFHIEQHLRKAAGSSQSGSKKMDYTIIRPTWFADNAYWGFPDQLCLTGWRENMKGKTMQVTVIRDIGRWAVEAFVRPDEIGIRNQALSIASDELSFNEVDKIFMRHTGKGVPVTYGLLARLVIWMVNDLHTMFKFIGERPYGADLPWLANHLKPTTFEQWVKDELIEYGAKILSKTAEYRSSVDGTLREHGSLRDVLQSLKGLNAELTANMASGGDNTPISMPNFESLRMSIKSMRYEARTTFMKAALAEAKNNLNIASLVFLQHVSSTRHDQLLKSNNEVEGRIISTLTSTSDLMEAEIRALMAQLSNTFLGSIEDAFQKFQISNQIVLEELSQKLDAVLSQQTVSGLTSSHLSTQTESAQQKILDSISFPLMEERRHHIAQAYKHTYEWMLQPQGQAHEHWDDFARWARSRDENERVYWLYGKPDEQRQLILQTIRSIDSVTGSGKSTLMRFLYETIDGEEHLLPWGQGRPVVQDWSLLLGSRITNTELLTGATTVYTCTRPWNVFQDAFTEASQLRLELLTEKDIRQDSVRELVRRVEDIPDDLDTYFTDLMDSIEPRHRKEASLLLQVALHKETAFISLHPLRLLDLLHSEEGRDDFALNRINSGNALDFTDLRNMDSKLDSALRCLNSRCLGLLECRFMPGSTEKYEHYYDDLDSEEIPMSSPGAVNEDGDEVMVIPYPDTHVPFPQSSNPIEFFNWHVDFLHRSFRDFLLNPINRQKLHLYYQGSLFVCNALLLQLEELSRSVLAKETTIGLASYVLTAISVPELRNTKVYELIAARIKPILDRLVHNATSEDLDIGPWYLCTSLLRCHQEKSSFLTIAIEFSLAAYVHANLTAESIRNKQGRPILDYLVLGGFNCASPLAAFPDLELVRKGLDLGADPNEIDPSRSSHKWSVWVWFLSEMHQEYENIIRHDDLHDSEYTQWLYTVQRVRLATAHLLLQHGASPVVAADLRIHEGSEDSPWELSLTHAEHTEFGVTRPSLGFISVADYLATLRDKYIMAAAELEACIALASEKLAAQSMRRITGYVVGTQ